MEKELPWSKFLSAAQELLRGKSIGEIELGKATYQIEVKDSGESYWPFLQFDSKGNLKDAFCSCDSDVDGCPHLACAYLSIFQKENLPLHERFERSFFFELAMILADRLGSENMKLEGAEGHYQYPGLIEIEAAPGELEAILQLRLKETPETSIKFSNFPQNEIEWWRDGRPSRELRFRLSYWFDLAKWMFLMEDEMPAHVSFVEDSEGFPTRIAFKWKEAMMKVFLNKEELIRLIPRLPTVQSPLKLFEESGGIPTKIVFSQGRLLIEHRKRSNQESDAKRIDGWSYQSGIGFFAREGGSFFSRNEIPGEDIAEALNNHRTILEKFFAIDDGPLLLSYSMWFDDQWNWHFSAYLKEKGDLKNHLFHDWAYIEGRGFVKVEGAVFSFAEELLSPEEVSPFVNHHRIWLNTMEGFQPHLASIESHLIYQMNSRLVFQSKSYGSDDVKGTHDFGDWVYYVDQGFFSKQHTKLGRVVRPGLEVQRENISSFIKVNREELESIPHFFTTRLPVIERGLEVEVTSSTSITLRPTYQGEEGIEFFGDFAYIKGEGFCELPAHFRLPELLQHEKIIEGKELALFLHDTLSVYEKYFTKVDPRMRRPHKSQIEIGYLVRTGGGLKAELFFATDQGSINVLEVHEAFEKKYSYLFTDAGFLDLTQDQFQWMKKLRPTEGGVTVEMSTMEFLKLEASAIIAMPTADNPQADISRRLLKELREFTVTEKPNLKGLKSELRLYQETGLNWLWFLYKNGLSALLCDDMGLGKTHQAMALMAAVLNQPQFKEGRFLVVCPTSVIYHWEEKLQTFLPGFNVHTFHGTNRSLKKVPKEGLILTSYGTFRMEKETLKKMHFEVAVFDEIQVAKNPSSQIHSALSAVDSKMKIGLTGTPIENNLRELKALFDIVLPGYMPKEARFRSQFTNPIERDLDAEKKAQLSALIRPFVLRRRKSEVLDELPEKSEDKGYCDLSVKQIALYKGALDQSRDEMIPQLRDRDTNIPFMHIFSLLSYLKQVCNHPALALKETENYQSHDSGKWDLFVELIEEARASGQKVVVFSQYLGMLDIIEAYLKEQGWSYAQIRGDTVNRKDQLKRFQEDPDCFVFIGSLQAAGLGIDLTAAQVVILYDRWWNAARENQAIDRVHRIGQKWGVQVFKLICKGTIEEKIDRMITKKGRLMEEIVATEDQGILKRFSSSELIDLLSYDDSVAD